MTHHFICAKQIMDINMEGFLMKKLIVSLSLLGTMFFSNVVFSDYCRCILSETIPETFGSKRYFRYEGKEYSTKYYRVYNLYIINGWGNRTFLEEFKSSKISLNSAKNQCFARLKKHPSCQNQKK